MRTSALKPKQMLWKIKSLIWKCRRNSRRNDVEISGIPQSVSDNQLEEKVVDILKAIDVNITTNEIEVSHRLGKKKENVIVRVINRKHCLKALQNKKKFKSMDKNAIGISNKVNFSKLAFSCQKLKRDGEIEKCYTINWNCPHRKKQ